MSPLHLVAYVPVARRFDAALPQAEALSEFSCQFGTLSAIVHAGRTQAPCTSRRGSECFPTLQEHRRRVCRAPRSFYRSAWLHSLQPAAALIKRFDQLVQFAFRHDVFPVLVDRLYTRADVSVSELHCQVCAMIAALVPVRTRKL